MVTVTNFLQLIEKKTRHSATFLPKVLLSLYSYGKELLQILHLAPGNPPDKRPLNPKRNQGLMDAQLHQR